MYVYMYTYVRMDIQCTYIHRKQQAKITQYTSLHGNAVACSLCMYYTNNSVL